MLTLAELLSLKHIGITLNMKEIYTLEIDKRNKFKEEIKKQNFISHLGLNKQQTDLVPTVSKIEKYNFIILLV